MEIHFDDAATAKLQPILTPDKKLLLTFEDGVGPYSTHAMMHMMVQFSLNVVPKSDPAADYDLQVPSNIGPVGVKGYSQEDLDPHLTIKFNTHMDTWVLSGDIGLIDDNMQFIDFTKK